MNGFFIFLDLSCPKLYDPSHDLLKIAKKKSIIPSLFIEKYNRAFNVCKTMAFNNLSKYSFQTIFGRFITLRAFAAWSIKQDKINNKFKSLKNDMLNNYDNGILSIKEKNIEFCSNLWKVIHDDGEPHTNFVIEVSNYLASSIPSKLDLYEKIKCDSYLLPCNKIILSPSYNKFKKDLCGEFLNKIDVIINPILEYKQIRINLIDKIKDSLGLLEQINIFDEKDLNGLIKEIADSVNEKTTPDILSGNLLRLKGLFLNRVGSFLS